MHPVPERSRLWNLLFGSHGATWEIAKCRAPSFAPDLAQPCWIWQDMARYGKKMQKVKMRRTFSFMMQLDSVGSWCCLGCPRESWSEYGAPVHLYCWHPRSFLNIQNFLTFWASLLVPRLFSQMLSFIWLDRIMLDRFKKCLARLPTLANFGELSTFWTLCLCAGSLCIICCFMQIREPERARWRLIWLQSELQLACT